MANCKNGIEDVTVLAPNKKKSNLFDRILKTFTGDKDSAYKTFLVTKTKDFKEWAKNIPKDNNGEPSVVYNKETQAFDVQSINKEKLADLKETNKIESIISKLGIFDTYFREGDNKNLSETLANPVFQLTREEISYVMSLSRPGEDISQALGARYSKLLNNDKVVLRLKHLKQKEYSQALDNNLVEFAKSIGVTVEVVNSLKEKFNINAAGVADILNKIIYVSKDRKLDTMAEEIGHFYSELMGYKDGIGRQLFYSVPNWSGYKAVYDKYKTVYTLVDGSPDVAKITKEAIGQAIAEGIIKNYAANSAEIPADERAFWTIIVNAIYRAVGLFKSLSYRNIDLLTADIAKKILANDNSDIISRLKETTDKNKQLKTYDASLVDFPDAKDVIDRVIAKFNGVLTGSLALRFHGTVYRNEAETIHDLDFSVPFSSWKGDDESFKAAVMKEFPNLLWVNDKPFSNDSAITYNAIITNKPELVERFRELTGNFNSRLENFTYEEQQEMLLIDLFLLREGVEIKHTQNLQDAGTIFNAKSQMGMRPKDSFDLLNYIPYEKPTGLSSYVYYQVEDHDTELIEDTLSAFELKDDKDIARLQALIDSTKALLKKRIKDLRKEANNLKAADKQKREDTIEELDQLLKQLEEQEYKEQFNSILGYALKNLQRSKEWLDSDKGFNPANETHVDTVLALWKQLDTYAGLNVPEYAQKHSQLSAKITEVDILYRDVKKSVEAKFLDTIVNLIQQNTTNDKFATREDILAFLKESNDIDGMQKWFIDMNSSSDTLLAVINKVYAYKLREIEDTNAEWYSKINEAGRKLVAAGIEEYEWMVEKDEKGKRTGNIVKRVQKAFQDALNELYALQDTGEIDEFGKKIKKQYIKKKAEEMSDEEIAFNIQLHSDKSALYGFTRAEFYDKKNKKLSDGENKRYKQEFKDQRAWFEVYAGNEWVKSGNDFTEEEYDKYIKTYYGPLVTISRMLSDKEETEDSNGNTVYGDWYKTGEIEEVEARFVKDLYVEITDAWNTKEYQAIQANPAMKEFYDFYTDTIQHILDRLPADVARKMQNKIFRFRDDYMSELLKEKTSVIKKVLQKIKGIFLPEIVTSNVELDENNMPIQSVGIYGTGDLRNEKKIADIQAEITKLAGTQDKAERIKLDQLKTSLLIEKNKLVADELVLDLVVSLKTAVGMAHAYDIKSSVQSTFHIAQEVIKNRTFYETDATGKVKLSRGVPQLKTGVSNVQDRLQTWMRMVFYNNSQANDSRIAKIGKLLKTYVSLKNVGGFAIFPAINNAITAEMSNLIEGAGGVFYENKNFVTASLMFAKTLASGKFVSHLFKQPGKYEDVKPVDKLTALVEYYNYLEENSDTAAGIKTKQSGKEYIMSGNVFYALTESVEYQAQTRSAIAFLDHKLVDVEEDFEYIDYFGKKQKTENKKIPLLEAHTFDEISKKLVLRKSVIFDVKMKRQTSEEIRNMNKNIHGNYSSTDKVAMQENWYGELAFQFKKWMPNAIRNRFGGYHGGYYDESTGMDMVGRYWAVGTMVRNMTTLGNMFNGETWKTLTPLEQANMRKNVAEAVMFATFVALYVIFGAIAEGIPPDDEYTKMAVNFLKMQADKSRSEITFFINPTQWYQQAKNPVAGLRTMGEIGEFFTALVGVPFYGLQGKTKKLKYEKGINKGEYKVWKEFRDLLPFLAQTNQVKQLGVTGEFFIK